MLSAGGQSRRDLHRPTVSHGRCRSKIKLIRIFVNSDPHVNDKFLLRPDNPPRWSKVLQKYPQFISLKTDQEREFVKSVLAKIFEK
jgi:hypothetical protein